MVNNPKTIIREVFEETGIELEHNQLIKHEVLWVENEGHEIEYHTFSVSLERKPIVEISAVEHADYAWVTCEKASELPLVHDLKECNEIFCTRLGL